MNISEKLSLFRSEKALDATELSLNAVSEYGIAERYAANLINCYFEQNVLVGSPVTGSSRNTFIGAYSYMNSGGYIRENVFIGRYCSIGRRVTIGAGMHAIHGLSSSPLVRNGTARLYSTDEVERLAIAKARSGFTILNNDIWVGDGVIVMPGITIGTGAVIGANSVVTKDVPPYAVVGGCPAKIIKYRFPDDVVCELLAIEWWNLSPEQLQLLPTGNVFQFIDEVKNNPVEIGEPFDTYSLSGSEEEQ
jgi:virginiamycin A acetyltransferase